LLKEADMTTCSHLAASGPALDLPFTPLLPRRAVSSAQPKTASRLHPIAVLGSTVTREQLFVSELALIERVIAWVCARRCLRGADAEDFASTVKLRLIEDDYAILGRFEGRSSLKTYVTAVVNRHYLDFQRERFGKWRPSAEARRMGPVALRLEVLLYRDRLTFEEACGVLQTDLRVTESREALYELSLKLPARASRGPGAASDDEPPESAAGLSAVEHAEREQLAERTFVALRGALARLPARDRILLRLHVESGLSVADVAKALGEQQKPLYRRRDALLKQLRLALEADGIGGADAHGLLSTLDWEGALTADVPADASFLEGAGSRRSPWHAQSDRQEGER
jgi:RNA polymerase sigma factor (sigma-70 family)